jgi:hypothetical protein
MKSICCQYSVTRRSQSPTFDNFFANESRAEASEPQSSLTLNTQGNQQIIDPNLFDSFFSGLGSWDLTQQANLAPRSPHRAFTPDVFSLNNSDESSPPEIIPLTSTPLLHLGSEEVTNSAALAHHSMELIFRVLRTWPQMLAEEFQLPPIFHSTHITPNEVMPAPLANCITLAKMWHGQCAGAEEMVRKTILRELDSIVDHSEQYDEATLLAVLQSVVIYTIILLSPQANQQRILTDHHIIFRKVELLVYHIVHAGLYLQEERTQKQPSWEAWLHVTSKRRAVLSLYLLHWAYSVLHKVPCFDCRDLNFMPAPAAKVLWQAQTEQEWNTRYIHWLSRWGGQGYLQGELGDIRPGIIMNPRAERWLEESDEFGFIMLSIGM